MSQGKGGRPGRRGALALVVCMLAALTAITIKTVPLRAAEKEAATSQSDDTTQRAQVLAKALQADLARRRRTPGGLGVGNGPGIGITPLLEAVIATGMPTRQVAEILAAAGFSMFHIGDVTGPKAFTATKDIDTQLFSKVYVIAIIMLRHNERGEEEMASVKAALKWSAL